MSPTGMKTFTTAGKQAKKFENTPFPAGDYDLKLLGQDAKSGRRPEPGKLPYVRVPFEALGTAEGDSGRNRRVYHTFFVSTAPGKDGTPRTEQGDQIVGLARSTGSDIEVGMQTLHGTNGELVECINAEDLVRWFKSNDGLVARAKVGIQNDKVFGLSNTIKYFIEPDEQPAVEEEYAMEELPADDLGDQMEDIPAPAPARKGNGVAARAPVSTIKAKPAARPQARR